jgi:uncharacterized protein involved in exopolysaccharide biosynthesis
MNQHVVPFGTEFTPPAQSSKTLEDYLLAFKRRRWVFSAVATIFAIAAILGALLWPPTYRSQATILIEQQEIPEDLVRSTITSYADQRIQVISQRVMTRSNLMGIIEKYDLYHDDRKDEPNEVILEQMRKDVDMRMISADVIDPRSGRPTQATIAFSLAYDNRAPDTARKVANELVSLYLNENLKSRSQLATDASGFLSDEVDKLAKYIAEVDKNLSAFKEKNYGVLPELNQINFQLMDRAERELADAERALRQANEQHAYLEAQLAQLAASGAVTVDGERVLTPRERLAAQRNKLSSLRALYSESHPDILRLQREIEGLEKEVAAQQTDSAAAESTASKVAPDMLELQARLDARRAALAAARQRYSGGHPDVQRLEREVNQTLAELWIARKTANAEPEANSVENAISAGPLYVQLQGQLKANELEQQARRSEKASLEAKIVEYERRLSRAPGVERQYQEFVRDRENAELKYRELKAKEMEARLAQSLESESKGERFTLIEPPELPERPRKPNRPVVAAVGLLAAVVMAVGYVLLLEALNGSVRDRRDFVRHFSLEPLAVLPYMTTSQETRKRVLVGRLAVLGGLVALVGVGVLINYLWMPLDVLMYGGMRRFGF